MRGEDVAADPGKGAAAGEECQQHSAIEHAEFHDAANLFPLMDEQALADLAADIVEHGLREPIWRHRDGRIIDGRNRWLACVKAGVECRHRTYEKGDDTIVGFVVSKNLHRRHLTTPQRAAVAAEIANLGRGANQHSLKAPSFEGTSQAQAAQLMGVSVASVERAAAVRRADPELHAAVKRGEITAGVARAAIAAAATPSLGEPEPEVQASDDSDGEPETSDADLARAAFTAVAKLKVSGTAAASGWEWTDSEINKARKALAWLKRFVRVVEQERRRRSFP